MTSSLAPWLSFLCLLTHLWQKWTLPLALRGRLLILWSLWAVASDWPFGWACSLTVSPKRLLSVFNHHLPD